MTVIQLRDALDDILARRHDLIDAPVEFTTDNVTAWRVVVVDHDNEGVTLRRRPVN
jgi:hypothetical protein